MTTQDEDTEPDVSSPIIRDGVCEESGTTVTEVGENPNSQDRDIKEGDNVVVKHMIGVRLKTYLGKVISSDEEGHLVMFMLIKVRGSLSSSDLS